MALFWKDFYLTAGGWRWFIIRLVAYPAISLSYGMSIWGVNPMMTWALTHETALRMVGWDTAIVVSQLFQREVRGQTWDALRFLPQSRWEICYSKLAGVLLALSPGWAWAAYASIHLVSFGYTYPGLFDVLFFASIVLVGCHVSTLVSVLFPRFTWTVALLLGVVAAHLELELSRSLVFTFMGGIPTSMLSSRLLLGSLAISVGLHGLIAWRIQHLSN